MCTFFPFHTGNTRIRQAISSSNPTRHPYICLSFFAEIHHCGLSPVAAISESHFPSLVSFSIWHFSVVLRLRNCVNFSSMKVLVSWFQREQGSFQFEAWHLRELRGQFKNTHARCQVPKRNGKSWQELLVT